MVHLSETDFKILEFIEKNEPVGMQAIKEKFSYVSAIEFRVGELKKAERQNSYYCDNNATAYILQDYEIVKENSLSVNYYLDSYRLSDFGRKTLQDYKTWSKSSRKETWLKNAWIPILVSLATNLLLCGIEQLWPLLQRWISSIL